jgi:hypothetical protein
VLFRAKKNKALNNTKKISNALNLRILNLSEGKKEWIEPVVTA